jgi:GNAT superfamily N-acetyltransferase
MDEVVFLRRWLETFARLGACVNPDGRPRRPSRAEADRLIVDPLARSRGYAAELIEARLFYPGSDEKPFAFVPETFERRKLICAENKRTISAKRSSSWD